MSLAKIVIPMIRRVMPNVIAQQLVGVQPMTGPSGMVFSTRYGLMEDGELLNYVDVKIGKGRKGKPHWRETRILRLDRKYEGFWKSVYTQYQEATKDAAYPRMPFIFWLDGKLKEHGGRRVKDIVYNTWGIHFDTAEDMVTFKLMLS